jgi:peptidylprolyl isomerase domain and WD repeat-containing protein 1
VEALPNCEQYEKSYMHRDVVTHIAVAKQTEFIVTGSADGQVKFWKKMLTGIEFVKHFQVFFMHF